VAAAVLSGEGYAPVGPVLLAFTRKADESIAAPKGHGPPDSAAVPLRIDTFLGATTGTTMAIVSGVGLALSLDLLTGDRVAHFA
jgi:hypothetical protein